MNSNPAYVDADKDKPSILVTTRRKDGSVEQKVLTPREYAAWSPGPIEGENPMMGQQIIRGGPFTK